MADKFQKSLLTADVGSQYDSVIEINLDTVLYMHLNISREMKLIRLYEIIFMAVAALHGRSYRDVEIWGL